MKKHIKQFTINEFKGIHNLTFDKLNAVNIIVGNNNCGKTSVLELLSTLQNPQYTGTWVTCTRARSIRAQSTTVFEGLYDLFPVEDEEKKISYNFIDEKGEKHFVSLRYEIEGTQITVGDMRKLSYALNDSEENSDDDLLEDTLCMHLYMSVDSEEVNKDIIYERQNLFRRIIGGNYLFAKTLCVSPTSYNTDTINLSHILSDSSLNKELIDILKVFDNDILGLVAIRDEKIPSMVEYKITKENVTTALPLNSYGDGMKKAVFLLNSVILARSGILLIDEFDTGIHNSAMDKVFSCLLESALNLDVQIFLTSHNREAIDKVLRCNEELQPFINVYTLYNYEGTNHVRMLNCKEAIDAEDILGLELR